jgi:hypothetical protein
VARELLGLNQQHLLLRPKAKNHNNNDNDGSNNDK